MSWYAYVLMGIAAALGFVLGWIACAFAVASRDEQDAYEAWLQEREA